MQGLTLEPPTYHHRRQNTAPAFVALDQAIAELNEARQAWTPEADNRPRLSTLAARVAEMAEDLKDVGDEDRELVTAERVRNEYSDLLIYGLRDVRLYSDQVFSDQEGVKPQRRKIARAVADVQVYAKAFRSGVDSRPQISAAYEAIKSAILEIQAVADIDAWAPTMTLQACDRALRHLKQESKLEPEPEPESRPVNQLRLKISDALYELINALGPLSIRSEPVMDSLEERNAVIQLARDLQREVGHDFTAEVTDGAHILERVRAVENAVGRLRNLDGGVSGPLSILIRDSELLTRAPLAKIRGLLASTQQPENPRPMNLLGRARQAFGWGDDEAQEVA